MRRVNIPKWCVCCCCRCCTKRMHINPSVSTQRFRSDLFESIFFVEIGANFLASFDLIETATIAKRQRSSVTHFKWMCDILSSFAKCYSVVIRKVVKKECNCLCAVAPAIDWVENNFVFPFKIGFKQTVNWSMIKASSGALFRSKRSSFRLTQ